MRKYLITGGLALFFIITLLWFYGHAFISVSVNQPKQNAKYTFTVKDSSDKTVASGSGTKFKKLLSHGAYQITVTQDGASYFSINTAGRFLSTTKATATLHAEAARTFVGDNPAPCMFYAPNKLVSYECESESMADLYIHQPASASQPSYAEQGDSPLLSYLSLDGFVTTGAGQFVLAQLFGSDISTEPPHHSLFKIDDSLNLSQELILPSLSANVTYDASVYLDGFVAFTKNFNDVEYFASNTGGTKTAAERITIDNPKDRTLNPQFLSVQKDSLTAVYTNIAPEDLPDTTDSKDSTVKGAKTEVVVYKKGSQKHFNLNKYLSAAAACGKNQLCVIADKKFEVYNISDTQAKLVYSVSGASDMQATDTGVRIFTDDGVLFFDTNKGTGYFDYALGGYTVCGTKNLGANYLLCVIGKDNNKHALLVDPTKENSFNVDKKISALWGLPEISNVSTNGSFIFISVNYGDTPSQNEVEYNKIYQESSVIINKALDATNINRTAFTIAIL